MDFFLDIFKLTFPMLPEIFQSIFSISYNCIFLIVVISIIIKPVILFFINHLINKNENKFKKIMNDKIISDKDSIKEECQSELLVIQKMKMTQCKDRMLAMFFYELTNLSKHKIGYTKFIRLYKYLSLSNEEIIIADKKIYWDRVEKIVSTVPFLLCFIFYSYLAFFYFQDWRWLLCFTMTIVLGGFIIYFCQLIVRTKEVDEFIKIKNIYYDKLKYIFDYES